jgi:7,8-dihydroneopterin aldolase/epimerase/oxygenase
VIVELRGLEVFGYHGVEQEERRDGQRFVFDVSLWVTEEPASDAISETVDYRAVAACVREVFERPAVQLLETLAVAVADELLSRFSPERVRVRVRKPDVQLDPPVEYSAVTVERP